MAGRKFDRGETVKMGPQQRARLQAYEPSKDAQRWMAAAGARARVHLTVQKSGGMRNPSSAAPECDRQKQIIAQLKATEARNRVRNMRLRYERIRAGCLIGYFIFSVYVTRLYKKHNVLLWNNLVCKYSQSICNSNLSFLFMARRRKSK